MSVIKLELILVFHKLLEFDESFPPGLDENNPSLGWRRMVLLVESSYSPDSGRTIHHARSLETFCAQNGIRLSLLNQASGFSKPATAFPSPFTSPLFTGSFPSSPLLYSPEFGPHRANRIDLVPPLSLDGHAIVKAPGSPPTSPLLSRQPSIHVRALHDKLQNLPQVGIIHLALQNDSTGSILRSNIAPLSLIYCSMHLWFDSF